MRKTLYLKFLLGYLVFGLFGFLVVCTYINHVQERQLLREEANMLYREANLLAQTVFVSYETGAKVEYPVKEVTPIFTEKDMKNRPEPRNKAVAQEPEDDDDIPVEGLEDIVD